MAKGNRPVWFRPMTSIIGTSMNQIFGHPIRHRSEQILSLMPWIEQSNNPTHNSVSLNQVSRGSWDEKPLRSRWLSHKIVCTTKMPQ
jgi:hypothetical protein